VFNVLADSAALSHPLRSRQEGHKARRTRRGE
jgi:hypothetical protein